MRAPRQTQCAQPSTWTARELHERVLVRVDATPAPHVPPGGGMKPAPVVRVRSPLVAASLARAARGRGVPASAFGWFGKRSAGAGASSTATLAMPPPEDGAGLLALTDRADHSWLKQLTPDPDTAKHAPNRTSREVRSGHYVRVPPTPLSNPRVAIHSPAMAANLGVPESDVQSERFARFFSGDADVLPGMETWATPYALSIMGQRQVSNCPFGNGNGYGDGRAVSVGEVVGTRAGDGGDPTAPQRWEMQLKGGGPTPFCRGADGRAVLRSSIREFLASEAMHALGVSTTRALSLVVSEGDEVRRPWYRAEADAADDAPQISLDDPRLARFDDETKRRIVRQASRRVRDPDAMIRETCAITTRVAPSFLRVGHVDLFSRRAVRAGKGTPQFVELEQIVRHAIFREFPDLLKDAEDPESSGVSPAQAAAFLRASGAAISEMVAGWLRVGFCQGNFNADNCLVGGRTMDYGPFGFMDAYDPYFAKWTGSGEHFAFANQPGAGLANFAVLAASVAPLLAGEEDEASDIVREIEGVMETAVSATWRRKLGLDDDVSAADVAKLWDYGLEPLMRAAECDYVVCFRQLADVALAGDAATLTDDVLLAPLADAFYEPLDADARAKWADWIRAWRAATDALDGGVEDVARRIKAENPKYVLREWMLVEAYTAAKERDDFSVVRQLFEVATKPYEEGDDASAERWYRRAPDAALRRGGTAFMS